MYEVHSEIKHIKAEREQVVAIIESINTPMVAAANKPLEPAKAFIVGVRNPTGTFSIFIYLHLIQSVECLVFLHNPPEIPIEAYHAFELEALQFVESMGFMVDNLNFRKLTEENQHALMKSLPVFYPDLLAFVRDQQAELGVASTDGEKVLDLNDVAEVSETTVTSDKSVPREGLAKIARLLSSF
jgi:hypothetical protein